MPNRYNREKGKIGRTRDEAGGRGRGGGGGGGEEWRVKVHGVRGG